MVASLDGNDAEVGDSSLGCGETVRVLVGTGTSQGAWSDSRAGDGWRFWKELYWQEGTACELCILLPFAKSM